MICEILFYDYQFNGDFYLQQDPYGLPTHLAQKRD